MKTFARGVRLVFVMEYSVRSALRRILLLASGLSIAALAQDQTAPAEREAHWRQDLQFFAAGLGASGHSVDFHSGISTRGQIDFAKLYPKGRFDAAIEALEADIPRVSDAEMVLGLMRLVASANVAHNSVVMPLSMGFFARLPLTFHWFPDGLAVIGASPEYSAALGTRVLRIGSMTPEQLLPAIAPYIAHENEVWLREQAVGFLRPQAVLQHFGLLDQDGRVALSLEKPGEPPFTLSVTPGDPRVTRIPMAEGLHTPVPLFRSQPGNFLHDSSIGPGGRTVSRASVLRLRARAPSRLHAGFHARIASPEQCPLRFQYPWQHSLGKGRADRTRDEG